MFQRVEYLPLQPCAPQVKPLLKGFALVYDQLVEEWGAVETAHMRQCRRISVLGHVRQQRLASLNIDKGVGLPIPLQSLAGNQQVGRISGVILQRLTQIKERLAQAASCGRFRPIWPKQTKQRTPFMGAPLLYSQIGQQRTHFVGFEGGDRERRACN